MAKIWAHRGASGYFPENTIPAFEDAFKQKVSGVEFDVHLSKDGYLVVCHDETLNRTTNGKGFIKHKNLFEIKQLDAGSWFDKKFKGIKIPLLDEVFELFKGTDITLNVEIKLGSAYYPDIEEKVITLVKKFGIEENVIISSFDHFSLLKIKELNSSIKTGALYFQPVLSIEDLLKFTKADALHPHYSCVSEEEVKKAKELNVSINVYTVDKEEDLININKLGVDVIMTNFPKRAMYLLK